MQDGSVKAKQQDTGGVEAAKTHTALEKEVLKLMQENLPGRSYYKWRQNVNLELYQRGLPGENVVDPAARIEQWSEDVSKYKGLKKNGVKNGIVREVGDSYIELCHYFDDEKHGL